MHAHTHLSFAHVRASVRGTQPMASAHPINGSGTSLWNRARAFQTHTPTTTTTKATKRALRKYRNYLRRRRHLF